MSTWNTSIQGNDTFLDIYQTFMDQYNEGQEPSVISSRLLEDCREMFEDSDDRHNALFGMALAQWETGSSEHTILSEVKDIVNSGADLKLWKEMGADEKTLAKRKKALDQFLQKISVPREKPKRRIRPKWEHSVIELVNSKAPDGKKTFTIAESYTNQRYIHTLGMLMWSDGGGSVLYYNGQGKYISARWLNHTTLEITHDPGIEFEKKETQDYYMGDAVTILYKERYNGSNGL